VWEALPDAKIIYIYRDGRDVANSLVQTYNVLSDEALTHLRSTEMRFGRRYDERYVPWWVDEGKEEEFISATQYGRAIWMWNYMVRRCGAFFESISTAASDRVLCIRYEELVESPDTWGNAVCEHLNRSRTHAMTRRLGYARTTSVGKHRQRPESIVDEMESIGAEGLKDLGYL
jgi:hypothetical protein